MRLPLSPHKYTQVPTQEELIFKNENNDADDGPVFDKFDTLRGNSQEPCHWSHWFNYVDRGCFQALSGCIILANAFMIAAEAASATEKDMLYFPEQIILAFYVFELLSRICYFRARFLCGPRVAVAWNILDIIVVLAGTIDQWILPILPVTLPQSLRPVLSAVRMLRLLRVLKLVRLILEADLTWTESPSFQSFIGLVIIFNSILMGLETDIHWHGWFYFEQVLLIIYVFELMARLKRDGRMFFCRDVLWNWLDFVIVVSSVMDGWVAPICLLVMESEEHGRRKKGIKLGQIMMLMRMLRLMRILRIIRLVKSVRPLYDMVMGVLAAVQGVFWVLVLTIVTLYAVGIITTRLVGHGLVFGDGLSSDDKSIMRPFATVPDSMFMLFKIMSGEQTDADSAVIDGLMGAVPGVRFVFVWFTVTSSWTLLSILTAVVSHNMISTGERQEKMLKLSNADQDFQEHLDELRLLFCDMDLDGNGTLEVHELETFLSDPVRREECANLCRVPARDVVDVMRMLSDYEKPVSLKHFIDCLTQIGEQATEKSVMKLEYKLKSLEHLVLDKLQDTKLAFDSKQEVWLAQFKTSIEAVNQMHALLVELRSSHEALVSHSTCEPLNAVLDLRLASFEKIGKEAVTELCEKHESWLHEQAGERYLLDVRLAALEMKSSAAVETMQIMKQNQEVWLHQQSALVLEALKATPHKDGHQSENQHRAATAMDLREDAPSCSHPDTQIDVNLVAVDFGRGLLSAVFSNPDDGDTTSDGLQRTCTSQSVDLAIGLADLR